MEDDYKMPELVSRYDAQLLNEISDKDCEIAMLRSDNHTDKKIVDTYTVLNNAIKELEKKMDHKFEHVDAAIAQQAVWNATQTGMIGVLKSQVEELMRLTRRRIPNSSICPGWGDVTIEPVDPTE